MELPRKKKEIDVYYPAMSFFKIVIIPVTSNQINRYLLKYNGMNNSTFLLVELSVKQKNYKIVLFLNK